MMIPKLKNNSFESRFKNSQSSYWSEK